MSMTADAFHAETIKLAANRGALFWGFAAVPALVLLFGALGDLFVWATVPGAGAVPRAPLLADMTGALSAAGNPIWHLFYIVGAATLFAGEYRWESWRFIVPRSSRTSLILGKMAAFALFAAVSLILIALAGLLVALGAAMLHSAPARGSAGWTGFALMFAIGWLQLCAIASLTALAAIATRSLLGALMPVFLFGLAQAVFAGMFGEVAGDPRFIAAMPNLAAGVARGWAAHLAGDPDAIGAFGPLAILALLGWIVVPLTAAIALFGRQDLSRE